MSALTPLAGKLMPAPTGVRWLARSSTVTRTPRLRSAMASVRPPIPAPAMVTSETAAEYPSPVLEPLTQPPTVFRMLPKCS